MFVNIFTQCDQPCNGGGSHRLVQCQDHLGQTLPAQQCHSHTRPDRERTCNTQPCQVFRRNRYLWKVGKWSQCSKLCGKGEQSRQIQCVDLLSKTMSVVGDNLCSGRKKPKEKNYCNRHPCPFVWQAGDWSQVSRFMRIDCQGFILIGKVSQPLLLC